MQQKAKVPAEERKVAKGQKSTKTRMEKSHVVKLMRKSGKKFGGPHGPSVLV